MSTGFIPFGSSATTQKIRVKATNNSTGNDDVYLLDYIDVYKVFGWPTIKARERTYTGTNYTLFGAFGPVLMTVVHGPKFQTPPDYRLKSKL